MSTAPRTAYDKVGELVYFPRMLDKIRLHSQNKLREDFHANLGKGMDGRLVNFLRVKYDDLKAQTLKGGTDEEILNWCYAHGRKLDENDIFIWNQFVSKLGWNDPVSDLLQKRKAESGFPHRNDIVTMFEYFEVDEGRKPV